ncbi:response regulator transcription factor [Shewanella oneidensis MR-1]|uniref:Two component signal transduction system response regulator of capsule flagella and curli biosynthesis RcsB n=1 Tax=Shewanella oneidensis (strain ATCC 700550 / JCM 31522 / CIP 106686 / LMG 19005 / NCIMB 14063 / MR-1) TaxID=211586 RepID=Q8E949_SHEON|nr:response regulator transcription factor [Shewanella oneidensis]AAN57409.1 two component signal transduction system response regulator of capsule flagella and curli biosynthesis RcsB [Shewanella oneidensis MR-1]MDX5998290.1 response regulator transcription factor [Shewanella oneidensis]MEE2029784.1 Transcriptional regulatory protein RcsB [Shewanella oneidensis]QKG94731.1 response regulator transcription factor [Shewanella oneidensis MR-1]
MAFKIILADDHPIILTGVRSLMAEMQPSCDIVAEANNVSELWRTLEQHECDLLITDFSMPNDDNVDGMAMIKQLRRKYPNLPIIVLTQVHNLGVLQALLQIGIQGLLLKKSVIAELEKTVKKVLLGSVYIGETVHELLNEQGINQYAIPVELSLKEIEVVRLLANGMSVTQVASYLNRSVKTISTQKTNAMQKLGLKSDSELFHYAQQQGLF